MQHFNRERIPERVVHAKGSGAYGTFTVTRDVTRYTRAAFLSEVGKRTETFLRFSTVAGERGAADAERDVRGFALKFYTEEGNWDMVGNNTPCSLFVIPTSSPSSSHPEAPPSDQHAGHEHAVGLLVAVPGIPAPGDDTLLRPRFTRSYRHLNGYGSHTYSLINADGERVWCKFHFKTLQGIDCLTDTEAADLTGRDRESHQRDLFEAIERGDFPRWRFCIQVMTEAQAEAFPLESL